MTKLVFRADSNINGLIHVVSVEDSDTNQAFSKNNPYAYV